MRGALINDKPSAKRVFDLIQTDFPSVASYIMPDVLPKGGTFIFGGEAKIGKSWNMIEFARCLTTGASPFEWGGFYVPELATVLVVEQEIGPRGLKDRMKMVMEKEDVKLWQDRLFYESKKPELQLDRPEGRKYLADMIRDVKPNVLILDPVSMMHGYNENNSDEIGKMFRHLEELKKLNPDKEMSVVLSHHFTKPMHDMQGMIPAGFDRLSPYNFRGSSKWKDTPDVILTMFRGKTIHRPEDSGWEGWENHVRWITRHGSSPPEMVLSIHGKADDGRVRFVRLREKKQMPKIVEGPFRPVKIPTKQTQTDQIKLGFTPA